MSRLRFKKGGAVPGESNPPVTEAYSGGGSEVLKEAKERKFGGRLKAEGAPAKMQLGRPGRKRGGRVGADKAPLSSAATVSHKGSTAGSL